MEVDKDLGWGDSYMSGLSYSGSDRLRNAGYDSFSLTMASTCYKQRYPRYLVLCNPHA